MDGCDYKIYGFPLLQPLDIFQNSLLMEIMDVGSLMLGARLLIDWIY